ncbi:MAG: hypothetical protein ACFWT2_16085 [Thermoanaerobacterium thermosaccharolyticum]|jgi:predicted peptidase
MSFRILISSLFFLVIVSIFPSMIKVIDVEISILLTKELKVNSVTKTKDIGIKITNAAIMYNVELNALVLMLIYSFLIR